MITLYEKKLYNCYIRVFEVPIYKSKVCFVTYKSHKGFKKAIKYLESINFNTDEVDLEDMSKCYGFVHKEPSDLGSLHVIFLNTHISYIKAYKDTLSHETTHLIQSICEHHGIEHYKRSANEHIAYLTGYVSEYLQNL